MAGESTGGGVGVLPENGRNILLTKVAMTVKSLGAGAAAFGVADCVVTIAVGWELCAVNADDSVDAVVAVSGATTLGLGIEASTGGVFISTSLVAVAPVPSPVPAGE